MNKRKILFMIHDMNVGGTEKSLLTLLSLMSKEKYDVTVLMLEKSGGYLEYIPKWVTRKYINGFDIIKPIITDPPLKTIKTAFFKGQLLKVFNIMLVYLRAKLNNNWAYFYKYTLKYYPIMLGYDVAIAYAGPSDFISYFIAEKTNAKTKLQWIHFDVTQISLKKNFGLQYYPKFDKIYCVSENSKIKMVEHFPDFSHKTEVFSNIVSKKEITESANIGPTFNDDFKGLRIVTLGRLSHEKGQQMIPNIVEKLKNDGIQFKWYCIGDGELRSELESAIKSKKIENYLVLLGLQMNPYRFLKDCDIYVQTSLHEGYCLTVHEAKIFNKPVVVTNVASATNLIVNNEDGFIVEINEEGIYNAVNSLITDSNLRFKFQRHLLENNGINKIKDF